MDGLDPIPDTPPDKWHDKPADKPRRRRRERRRIKAIVDAAPEMAEPDRQRSSRLLAAIQLDYAEDKPFVALKAIQAQATIEGWETLDPLQQEQLAILKQYRGLGRREAQAKLIEDLRAKGIEAEVIDVDSVPIDG